MRILHLNHTGIVSGAEHSLLTLTGVLRERHELTLAAPAGELLVRARALGVPVIEVAGMQGSWRIDPVRTPAAIAATVRAGAGLRRLAREQQIDVVHANSLRAGLIASVARSLGGPRFVVHVRDGVGSGRAAAAVKALVAGRADGVIAVSEFVARDWRAVGGARGKLAVVHNPIDCDLFHPDGADGAAWRARAGIAPGAPLLAVVGQITPWKRQLQALETFRELLAAEPAARLVVAGAVKFSAPGTRYDNPAYERRLHERCRELGLEEDVLWLGERDDVPSILRAADVLLAPAAGEPFGRAVAEALATGTPAVVEDGGGAVEFLRDGIDGVVVRSATAAAWAAGCIRALELAGDAGLAERRRAHACSLLSKDGHADAVEQLLARAAT